MLPASTKGAQALLSQTMSTCPASAAVTPSFEPRKGTCVSSTFSSSCRVSIARWLVVPMPLVE